MVFDEDATRLLKKLKAASDAEGVAVAALLAYMQGGGKDDAQLGALADQMTATHHEKLASCRSFRRTTRDK
jgi:hypothetical protein